MGATEYLENEQECLASSCGTEKCAFSKASSADVLKKQKCLSCPPVDGCSSVISVSSKQSSDPCLSCSTARNGVQSKQHDSLQTNVISMFTIFFAIIVKLLMLLDGVLTGVVAAVSNPSSNLQNKCRNWQSKDVSTDSPESKLSKCFYGLSSSHDTQVFEVAAVNDVEMNAVDVLHAEDVMITEVVLNNDLPSFVKFRREINDKPMNDQVELKSSALNNDGSVSCRAEKAEAVSDTCLSEKRSSNGSSANTFSSVTSNALDSICFPFVANSSIISVSIECSEFQCLVDTGAAITAVSANVWKKYLRYAYPSLDNSDLGDVTSVDGAVLNSLGKATMQFVIQSQVFPFEVHVIGNLTYDVIIGRNFLQQYGSKIDFEIGIIELFSEDTPLVASDLEACTRVFSVHADFSFVIPPQ